MFCAQYSFCWSQTGATRTCSTLTHLFLLWLVPKQSLYHLADLAERWTLRRLQIPAHLHDHVTGTKANQVVLKGQIYFFYQLINAVHHCLGFISEVMHLVFSANC